MKQTLLLVFLLFSCFAFSQTVSKKPKIIIDPLCEVNTSGVFNVSKVELSDLETRLTIQCITFIPNWWVSFSKKESVLRDTETGKIYEITRMEGGELDQKIWMKKSGDSTFVLIFPPLDIAVKKIDFGKTTFGISLDPMKSGKQANTKVPANIANWINESHSKQERKTPLDFNSSYFFSNQNAKLIGYIKGYDKRLGFTTGLVYTSNELTREDFPTVVQIHPDGRFEADLPFNFPRYTTLSIKEKAIPFYIEPGQTLSMIVDWEEFLVADRMRNSWYQFKNVVYGGPLAKINHDLVGFTPAEFNYEKFMNEINTLSPENYKTHQKANVRAELQRVNGYIKNNPLTPQASRILLNSANLEYAIQLLDFVDTRKYLASKDTANQILKLPVPDTYFDFLKEIPMNDNSLLACRNFSTFVNRFEYCPPLSSYPVKNYSLGKPKKDFLAYLLEAGIELSEEDKELEILNMKMDKTEEEELLLESKKDQIQAFYKKHEDKAQAYWDKYLKPLSKAMFENHVKEKWHSKDSLLQSDLGMESSLVYEITKIRSLRFEFEGSSPQAAKVYLDYLMTGITNNFLITTGNQLYSQLFPVEKTTANTLPDGIATDIFRKIVDPFKGKVLFIDFWATTCGPCVGGIKAMKSIREKYKDNKDFEFIFITDVRSSPTNAYNKFVEEQGLKNIYRLSIDDFNYLRQLFKFNGIPHYTVLDREGKVITNNFPMHNFEHQLKGILSSN